MISNTLNIRHKTRIQIYQVLVITLFWAVCGAYLALYKCVNYDVLKDDFIFFVPHNLSLVKFVLINILGPAIGGLIGGSVIVFILNQKYRSKSYRRYITVTILYFFVVIISLNTIILYVFYYKDQIHGSENVWKSAIDLLILDPYSIRNLITWMIIVFFTLHGLKIYEKFGPGTLFSMFLGKYHRPHQVGRVFMFLDLSNSTSIAEKLGHVRFFALIRDFYNDITDPILNSQGHIYQYVGDEVVISWPPKEAVFHFPNCITCFFRIEDAILKKEKYYLKEYGLVPEFKAAIHKGNVIVGEIGIIKTAIVFSGDTLNTTARMMGKCRKHHQKLIISQDILDMATRANNKGFNLDPLGKLPLRGKLKDIELFGVKRGSFTDSLGWKLQIPFK